MAQHKNAFKVIGTAVETWEDPYAMYLLLTCDTGLKGNQVVIRVWRNDLRDTAKSIRQGETVEVTGHVNSRQASKPDKNGVLRWFTDVEAHELTIAAGAEKEGWPPRTGKVTAPPKADEPGDTIDPDGIPF